MSAFLYCVIIDRGRGKNAQEFVATGRIQALNTLSASERVAEMYQDAIEIRIVKERILQKS